MRRTSFRMSHEDRRNEQRRCRDQGHWFWPILAAGVVDAQQCQFCGHLETVSREAGAAMVDEMKRESQSYRDRRVTPPEKKEKPPLAERLTESSV